VTRSDPKQQLFNGETGILIRGEERAYFPSWDQGVRSFPESSLPPFEYAYCFSVHKSQGSEYDKVLLFVPEGSEVFGREVLYTAITRAKRELLIEGFPPILQETLQTSCRRQSQIVPRLCSSFSGI
jgi:exodeoxyribonuclease V alpha subunit